MSFFHRGESDLKPQLNLAILIVLSLSSFIGPFGGSLLIPVLKELSNDFNVIEVLSGLTIALYMVPFSLFQLVSGYLSDKYDRKKIMFYGSSLYTLGALLSYFSRNFIIFLLIRVIQGIGSALISPTTMALVGDLYPRTLRGKVMGVLTVFISLGNITGAVLGGILGLLNWRLIFLAMTASGAILSLLVALFIYDPRGKMKGGIRAQASYFDVIKNNLVLLIGISGAAVFFSRWSLNTFLSYVVRNYPYNLPSDVWGNILSLSGWGSILAGFISGYLVDKLGRRKVIKFSFSSYLLTLLLFLHNSWFSFLYAIYFIMGFLSGTIFTALNTLIIEVDKELRATSSSIYGSIRFAGYALGPIIPIPIYSSYGLNGVIILNLIIILSILLLWIKSNQ